VRAPPGQASGARAAITPGHAALAGTPSIVTRSLMEKKSKARHNMMQLIGMAELRSDVVGDFLLF